MNRILLLGVFCICTLGLAQAEKHETGSGACHQDVEKLCSGIQSGEGRIAGCLQSHQADLSEGCRHSIADHKAKMEAKRAEQIKEWEPCNADVKKFCSEIKPGHGRRVRCLGSHETELTPACRDVYRHEKEKMKAKREAWEKHHHARPPVDAPAAAPPSTPEAK